MSKDRSYNHWTLFERGSSAGWTRWIAVLMTVCTAALGEESVTGSRTITSPELFQARLHYGVAERTGGQTDSASQTLTYSGLSTNDLALDAWGWLLLDGHLGLFGSLHREAFALYDGGTRVTGGSLLRAAIGPTGRLTLGPVKLDAAVGYAFDQLPVFGSSASPAFRATTRHGVLLAARGIVDVGPVSIEAHGEVPISLAAIDLAGGKANSSGFSVGGAIRLQLIRTGGLMWGLLADVSYVSDSTTGTGGLRSDQSMIRGGGAVDVKWQEEAVILVPLFGDVQVRIVDAQTGLVMSGAQVEIGTQPLVTDATGIARLSGLLPGAVSAKASAGGYVPAQAEGTIAAGSLLSLEVKLKKEAPKVGNLVIVVSTKELKKPIARATVKVGDATALTDEQGTAKFGDLPPGPIAIAVTADGYNPAEEAGSVVAGKSSEVTVAMVEVKQRIPATITGLVRSTAGGKPVAADLEIPQAKSKTQASASGAFTFRLEGGTYTVNISAPGYLSQTKSVTVRDGDQAIFNVDLHPR